MEQVGNVNRLFAKFVTELEKPGEHGVNNNELKCLCEHFWIAATNLRNAVQALPPEGRVLEFSANVVTHISEMMGRMREPGS